MSMMTRLSPSLIRLIAGPCLALTMAATLTACASTEETPYVERPVETIYSEAAAAMDQERYKEAARLFDEVERQHPYSQWATRAQLMSAYAQYQANSYDEAVAAAERFIELHPGHQDV